MDKYRTEKWLPLDIAARYFGYAHKESLSRRLRQLRDEGQVRDIGRPPIAYKKRQGNDLAGIILMWPNPKTALLRSDAQRELLSAKRGRPSKSKV